MNKRKQYFIDYWKTIIPKDKYAASGIYCIKVNQKIVYIGKSKSMWDRIANHIWGINYTKRKKYELLRAAKAEGDLEISFDVLEYVPIEELDKAEGEWIRKYMPLLNTQIPYPDGGWWNKNINNLTLSDLRAYVNDLQF